MLTAKRLKTDYGMAYIPTQLHTHLVKQFTSGEPIVRVDCLVGAKGVGKSSLLRGLYATLNKKLDDVILKYYPSPSFIEQADWVGKGALAPILTYARAALDLSCQKSAIILIDDFQELCTLPNAYLRHLIKHKRDHPTLRLVFATSSLASILASNIISHDEYLQLHYVNPQQDVTKQLFTRSFPKCNDDDFRDKVLNYFGHIPRFVALLSPMFEDATVETRHTLWKSFKKDAHRQAISILTVDANSFTSDETRRIYSTVLAIMATGAEVDLGEFGEYGLSPHSLPWTLFKTSHKSYMENEKFTVTVAGPWCQEACLIYLSSNEVHLEDTLKITWKLLKNLTGLGNVTGRFLELMVWFVLKSKGTIEMKYFYATNAGKGNETRTSIREGKLSGFGLFTAKKYTERKRLETSEDKKMIYYTPYLEDVDFVIVDETGKSHGIQVSFLDWKQKCQKDFYLTKDYDHIYLLTTQAASPDLLEKATKFDSKFKVAFNEHKLRVVDASSVLANSGLDTLRVMKGYKR